MEVPEKLNLRINKNVEILKNPEDKGSRMYEEPVEKLQLERVKTNRSTGEETIVPFRIYEAHVICLYKDRTGVYISDQQGYTTKVPYTLNTLKEYLGL